MTEIGSQEAELITTISNSGLKVFSVAVVAKLLGFSNTTVSQIVHIDFKPCYAGDFAVFTGLEFAIRLLIFTNNSHPAIDIPDKYPQNKSMEKKESREDE